MSIIYELQNTLAKTISQILNIKVKAEACILATTPKDNLGDYALACFNLAKQNQSTAPELAKKLADNWPANNIFEKVEAFGPYLNLFINGQKLAALSLDNILKDKNYGQTKLNKKEKVLIEFSGPNTNKPQHIGHLRNNCLGQALVNLYQTQGYQVIAANIINDRGIHIVKSMLAWQEFGNNETPASTGIKGDHLVGKYYVKFGELLSAEERTYLDKNNIDPKQLGTLEKRQVREKFLAQSVWMHKAQDMLKAWEQGDPKVKKLWQTMNAWVYDGYKKTYNDLGIKFDHIDLESDTYLLGKDLIKLGLDKKVFFTKPDNSVWIDLRNEGLDEKIVLRSDGTSVYMTQDLGTAKRRHDKFKFNRAIYVVASEQDYHFKVLFLILKKLGFTWADYLHHLSYGMVSRPEGKIKSREGKTADADTIIVETIARVKEMMAKAEKKIEQGNQEHIAKEVALAAIKFAMLGTNPQKDIVYQAESSITLDGYTGPFVQYTHARISQILKQAKVNKKIDYQKIAVNLEEKKLLKKLLDYPEILTQASLEYNPAVLTHYLFELAKIFNNFYQQHSVLKADTDIQKNFRLLICLSCQQILHSGLNILGITALDKM